MNKHIRTAAVAVVTTALTVLVAPASLARPVWDTSRVTVTHNVRAQPKVIDLRVGEHARFDRVVIDLDGKVPGYHVSYVKHLAFDGSGDRVPLKGRKFLAISLFPAKAHNRSGDSVYDGPRLEQYHFATLRGAAFTGDFEGSVSLGLSARFKADFRVQVLHAPNRIIIDLRHPGH
jgi:hypothetical protein